MGVTFQDNTIEVISAMAGGIEARLEEAAAEIESQTKRNSRVDTGETKNSWKHQVTGSVMAGEFKATIGSDHENAIWEEFGTGEYAINGDGRKGGWWYQNKTWGYFIHTYGKHPNRAFYNAYTALKNPIKTMLENAIKGL